MNIKQRRFIDGEKYEGISVYHKPLEKFAKFGTSGVRWLVGSASELLEDMPERMSYYLSNGYKRTVGGKETLAEDFNMPNVGAVVKSIALYNLRKAEGAHPVISGSADEFKKKLFKNGLLVMYDNRPGNEDIAKEIAKILAAYGIKAVLNVSDRKYAPTPIPAVSRLVRVGGYAGSITLTASHNGDEWNGIKFEAEDGGAASPEVTNAIGAILAEELALKDPAKPVEYDITEDDVEALIKQGKAATIDMLDFYVQEVAKYLDVEAIKRAIKERRVEFIYSAFFGSSGPVIVKLFDDLGLSVDNIIETQKSAGQEYVPSYEPTLEKLVTLVSLVEKRGREISEKGLKTVVVGGSADNDADRFQVNQFNRTTGRIEEYPPEKLAAVLGHYLYKHRGFKGPMGRSFVSGTLQDQVARLFGYKEPIETATGFKFSPKVFIENKGILFTEESYGLSFKDWTLDKDGILPSLLALELVAVTGKSLDEYHQDVLSELSKAGLPANINFKRYDLPFESEDLKKEAIRSFSDFFNGINVTKQEGAEIFKAVKGRETIFAGRKIAGVYNPAKFDGGMKVVFENGSWIAFRSSGTEPIIRVYVEGRGEQEREELKRAVFGLIGVSVITTDVARAIWEQNPSIWAGFPHNAGDKQVVNWMGWLRAPETFSPEIDKINDFADKVPYKNIVVLGTGGSGRGARTLAAMLNETRQGKERKNIIVSYTPQGEEVNDIITQLNNDGGLANTLFIAASKSGTTTETVTQDAVFRAELQKLEDKGLLSDRVMNHFVVITDEGSKLATRAGNWRETFINNKRSDNAESRDIGGRYSALSLFGIVPLAMANVDVRPVMEDASAESKRISAALDKGAVEDVAGFKLAKILEDFRAKGLEHVIQIQEGTTKPTGPWAEQLINESLCKKEDAPLWVYGEPLMEGKYYNDKVIFIKLVIGGERGVRVSELNGRPLIEAAFNNVGELILNMEIAATAWGHAMGINPFTQESVENSKNLTRSIVNELDKALSIEEAEQRLRAKETEGQTVVETKEGIKFYFAGKTADIIKEALFAAGKDIKDAAAKDVIAAFLGATKKGDYIGLFHYTNEDDNLRAAFGGIRKNLKANIAERPTTLFDFGSGFHHSNNVGITSKDGATILMTFESRKDAEIKIPRKNYTTNQLIRAMVRGELGSLQNGVNKEMGDEIPIARRAMWMHLPLEYRTNSRALAELFDKKY